MTLTETTTVGTFVKSSLIITSKLLIGGLIFTGAGALIVCTCVGIGTLCTRR
jgi:hypothetical protein